MKVLNRSSLQGGFTLLEVMVVLGIISALLAFGIPRLNLRNDNIKTVSRQLSVLTRECRNQARLRNRTYRIVFDMPPDNKVHSYWVEYADGAKLAPSQATLEREEKSNPDEKKTSGFQKDEKMLKKPRELPKYLFFGQIEDARHQAPTTEGEASIYFSPDGLVEKSAIQITNHKGLTWTLIPNPLTGRSNIIDKSIQLKDALQE